ncbi:hypothetical protein Cva_00222 [Caedimonas varicaedens]|uniref:Uncharacterized protein n=1 Tax=Caedimonas varicaedens TaxID=1629334 RepID=A0A0K8MAR0_9PROT|nr:hypothetical protein Cva_00222 [Caedimonas varicaedens]
MRGCIKIQPMICIILPPALTGGAVCIKIAKDGSARMTFKL